MVSSTTTTSETSTYTHTSTITTSTATLPPQSGATSRDSIGNGLRPENNTVGLVVGISMLVVVVLAYFIVGVVSYRRHQTAHLPEASQITHTAHNYMYINHQSSGTA
jgi:hypothetical protein